MGKFSEGDKVICIKSCTGIDLDPGYPVHHNPPTEGEEFNVRLSEDHVEGEFIVLYEVTDMSPEDSYDGWPAVNFKHLGLEEEREIELEEVEEIGKVKEYVLIDK